MVDVIFWILFGAIIGWVGTLLVSGRSHPNSALAIGISMGGALLGGVLARHMNGAVEAGFDPISLVTAVVAAIMILTLLNVVFLDRNGL
ncbi:MAG TPA: hypothetical protein VLI54_04265 [Bacillota bacterium]|nr:hypothetical protein [Bacillota bacterium]